MEVFRCIKKPVSLTVTAGMLALSLHMPVANATMISTEAVVHTEQSQQIINSIHQALNREDVKAKLVELGVDQALVQARVDALSDEEAQQLAQQLDEMPAAGGVVGALVLVFLVLLVTDLLGLTDVFTFTKKGALRK